MSKWKYALSSADAAPLTAPILLVGSIEENLAKAAGYGYDGMEVHMRHDIDIDIDSVLAAIEKTGVKLSAVVTGRLNTEGGCDLVNDRPYIEEAAVKGMKAYIDIAQKLHSDIVLGWAKGNVPAGGDRAKYLRRLAKNLKILDSYAGERGVKIFIEIINHYEVNIFCTAAETMEFLETYDLPNCYAHLDIFHMNIDEPDFDAAIRRCGKRLGYIHLADAHRSYPGTSRLDFKAFMNTLEEIGYDGYLSIECFPTPDRETAAREGVKYLKSIE